MIRAAWLCVYRVPEGLFVWSVHRYEHVAHQQAVSASGRYVGLQVWRVVRPSGGMLRVGDLLTPQGDDCRAAL